MSCIKSNVAVSCLSLILCFHCSCLSLAQTVLPSSWHRCLFFVAATSSVCCSKFWNGRLLRFYHWLKFRKFRVTIGVTYIAHALIQSFWAVINSQICSPLDFCFWRDGPLRHSHSLWSYLHGHWWNACLHNKDRSVVVSLDNILRDDNTLLCCFLGQIYETYVAIWSLQHTSHPAGYKLRKTDKFCTPTRVEIAKNRRPKLAIMSTPGVNTSKCSLLLFFRFSPAHFSICKQVLTASSQNVVGF